MRTKYCFIVYVLVMLLAACSKNVTSYEEEIIILRDNLSANVYVLGSSIEFDYEIDSLLINSGDEINFSKDEINVLIINLDSTEINNELIEYIENLFKNNDLVIAFYNLEDYYEQLKAENFSIFNERNFDNYTIVVAKKIGTNDTHFNKLEINDNQNEESLELMLLKMINDSIEFSND